MSLRYGFILVMTPEEADFFRALLGSSAWYRLAATKNELSQAMLDLPGPARLVSFCSDLIIPESVINALDGQCFNFHSGPPERPGYRPTAFAAAEQDCEFGVTFHRLTTVIDGGPIYATRRFSIDPPFLEPQLAELTYEHLIVLAQEVAPLLADFTISLEPNGDVWSGSYTSREHYRRLNKSALPS